MDDNQPALRADVAAAFPLWGLGPAPIAAGWAPAPHLLADLGARDGRLDWTAQRAPKAQHGRWERRQLWALADPELNAYVGSSGSHQTAWPHLQQVCRLERHRVLVRGGQLVKAEHDISYAITSLRPEQADAGRLLQLTRGHWGIENRCHWVRDVTFNEDRCQVRNGAAPQVLAACATWCWRCCGGVQQGAPTWRGRCGPTRLGPGRPSLS